MKILIASDIHIGDYPNYEAYRYQRLRWSLDLADRLIEIARKNNIKHLFLAGDTLDKPTNNPIILGVAKQFLRRISNYFDKIYYINGQHDLSSKNYDLPDLNKYSIMNVLSTDKMEYKSHQIFELGGRRIAMMDFHHTPDLSWIEEPVDLFVGHVTINTNGFGSDIDYSKFTLGIAGDIHYPCSLNNLHSVGVGIQRYLGDAQDGSCVIVDLDTLEWHRELYDPNHELFTRYIKTNNWDKEGPSEEKLLDGEGAKYYYIYRSEESSELTFDNIESLKDERVTSINEIISETVHLNELDDIHAKVLAKNPIQDSVDLDFQLVSLEIQNIRSIDKYTWNFENVSGTYQVAGDNGSGKSSLIWSLYYALTGGNDINNEIREGEEYAYVYLKLRYQGKLFGIYRGTDGPSLDIDGETQGLGGKKATEAAIYEYLPFIYFLDSFFFQDFAVSILESYSAERRIELLSTYFRLDVIQSYHDAIQDDWNEVYDSWDKKWKEWQALIAEDKMEKDKLDKAFKNLGVDPDTDLQDRQESLGELLEAKTEEYNEAILRESKLKDFNKEKVEMSIVRIMNEVGEATSRLSVINRALSDADRKLTALRQAGLPENPHPKEVLDSKFNEIREIDTKLEAIGNRKAEIKPRYKFLKKQLEEIKSINCPNCGEEIKLSELSVINIEDVQREKDSLYKEYSELDEKYEQLDKEREEKAVEYNNLTKDNENLEKVKQITEKKENLEITKKDVEELIRTKKGVKEDLSKSLEENSSAAKTDKKSSQDIAQEMDEIRSGINSIKSYLKTVEDYEAKDYPSRILALEEESKALESLNNRCEKYSKLFESSGPLYEKILASLLHKFSSDRFRYEVKKSVYRGKEYSDIVGFYKDPKMKNFREYSRLSRGQRTLVDLDFIKNLITKAGIVVFDEILKYLSPENQIEGLRIIAEMNPNLKIITSQGENTLYVDQCLNLEYDGNRTIFI